MPKRKTVIDSTPDAVTAAPETPESFPEASASAFSSDERPKKARLGAFIPLNEDGSIDEKRLKGDTSKVEAVRRALNLSTGGAGEQIKTGMEVKDDFVKGLYSAVEVLLQKAGTLFLKWPRELAAGMKYTEEQKDKLTPPTKAVIEKLAPSWLVKHQELATFAVVFTAVTQEMVQNALVQYIRSNPQVMQPKSEQPTNSAHHEGDALAQPVQ